MPKITSPHLQGRESGTISRYPLTCAWWCSHGFRRPISERAALWLERSWRRSRQFNTKRFSQQIWFRYGMRLQSGLLQAASHRATTSENGIEAMTADHLAEFTNCYPSANQVVTANALWMHGLRRAFVARDTAGAPVAFTWVLSSNDNPLLATLPHWSGIYPPIPPGWLQLENVFSKASSLEVAC